MNSSELQTKIREDFLKLMEQIGAQAEVNVSVEEGNEGMVYANIEIEGAELGYMIGSKGRHLAALQYVFSMMVNRAYSDDNKIFVTIDVGGYRKEKYAEIEQNALRRADDARILGDPVDLEPMSASERRIVHAALSKFDDIRTESFGDGRERFVRIYPIAEADLGKVSKTSEEEESESEE